MEPSLLCLKTEKWGLGGGVPELAEALALQRDKGINQGKRVNLLKRLILWLRCCLPS